METKRLNPFAFQSETKARFILLVITALAISYEMGNSVGINLDIVNHQMQSANNFQTSEHTLPEIKQQEISLIHDVKQIVMNIAFKGAFSASVFTLSLILYLTYPFFIRRRNRLQELHRIKDPYFFDTISALIKTSNLAYTPRLLLDTNSKTSNCQVFGSDKSSLKIGGGLRLLLRQNPDYFRAIILHELAHITNGDVQITYFSRSIWNSLILISIPFLIHIALYDIRVFPVVLFQILATLIIATAILRDILRWREIYADWKASLWGARLPLIRILHENQKKDQRWKSWVMFHPTPKERLDALENPTRLFLVDKKLPFFIGFLLSYVLQTIASILPSLHLLFSKGILISAMEILKLLTPLQYNPTLPNTLFAIILFIIFILFFIGMYIALWATILTIAIGGAYLIIGSLGIQIEKEAIARIINIETKSKEQLSVILHSLVFSVGYLVGIFLRPNRVHILAFFPNNLIAFIGYFPIANIVLVDLLSFLVLLTLVFLWFNYMRYFSYNIIGNEHGDSPSRVNQAILIFISIALSVMFFPSIDDGFSGVEGIESNIINYLEWQSDLWTNTKNAIFIYCLVLIATWSYIQIRRLFIKDHCINCKQVINQKHPLGSTCKKCGYEFSKWLFVD